MSKANDTLPLSPELRKQTPSEVILLLIELVAKVESLTEAEARATEAEARATEAEARVKELEERLSLTSQNSSKPPSSDPPGIVKPLQKRSKKKRQRGGQPGHKGHHRELLPPEEVDEIVISKPDICSDCGHEIQGLSSTNPERHQVTDIPPIKPYVTEYQIHHIKCPDCGCMNSGSPDVIVPKSRFGSGVITIVALCTGQYQLSKRLVVQMLQDFFGIILSLGSICGLEHKVSKALEQPVKEAADYVKNQKLVNADETGMNQQKKRGWLWVFRTVAVCYFVASLSRSGTVARDVLGPDFAGTLYSDRYGGYSWVKTEKRQFCWAHLLRDFKKIMLKGGRSAEYGNRLVQQTEQLFHLVHRVKDGTLSRGIFEHRIKQIRSEIEWILGQAAKCVETKKKPKTCDCKKRGQECVDQKTVRTCKRLLKNKESMWVFLQFEHLELTNNAAERALRPAVIYRKRSFGIDSNKGARFFERIMTTVTSLRAQNRHVLSYVRDAVDAHIAGEIPPSLLPLSSTPPKDTP